MDSSAATIRNNPAARKAAYMALIGMGLLVSVVAGWLRFGADRSVSADPHIAAGTETAMTLSLGGDAAAIVAVGFILLLAACAMLLQSLRDRALSPLRDPLTGLYTRFFADEVLQGLAARDDREGCSRLTLVRVDVETIDELRHQYGGAAVEHVMAAVGRHIRSQTREEDLPVEPDERGFVIYLHGEEPDQARAFCRRLATLLRCEQLDWHGDVIKVSADMGITVRKVGESLADLHQRAAAESVPALV
jgi:diguanylate cyclase (GGDEF)-like protein